METNQDRVDIFTNTPPSVAYANDQPEWNKPSLAAASEPTLCPPTLFRTLLPSSGRSSKPPWLVSQSLTGYVDPVTRPGSCRRDENLITPVGYPSVSVHGTSGLPVLLDTRKWSPTPSFVSPQATLQSQFRSRYMEHDVSHFLPESGQYGFMETFTSGPQLACSMASNPRHVITHPAPDLRLSFGGSMKDHQKYLGSTWGHSGIHTGSGLAPLSSSSSTEDVLNIASNKERPSTVVYRPPEKKGSSRGRSLRARAVNVEGLWIDEDDLRSGLCNDSGMVIVHECRWVASSGPCGMWIVGSRSHIGSHIRTWHDEQRHVNGRTECLWSKCGRKMQKDSISRHVASVHLEEAFHCQGCDQEFPRKDVYNQHVANSEACRGSSASIVYGIECRVIDTRQALHRGGAVRYAGR